MDTGTYGYEATPLATQVAGASFDTLVSGPGGSALVGHLHRTRTASRKWSRPSTRTSTSCRPSCCATARWTGSTRGVYFGDQRNYLETNIDDNFLSDDSWSTTTHDDRLQPGRRAARGTRPTSNTPPNGRRRTNSASTCCSTAAAARLVPKAEHGSDPLLTAFQTYKNSFGWISHTWDHPNLDIGCASQSYIEAEHEREQQLGHELDARA